MLFKTDRVKPLIYNDLSDYLKTKVELQDWGESQSSEPLTSFLPSILTKLCINATTKLINELPIQLAIGAAFSNTKMNWIKLAWLHVKSGDIACQSI